MIVHVEGDVAGGKSTAAKAVARALGWRVVSVDQFRDRAACRRLAAGRERRGFLLLRTGAPRGWIPCCP
jgi:cytidylate kinase